MFRGHPFLHEVWEWNKADDKNRELLRILRQIRKSRFDLVINLQRFLSTGILTAFSGAVETRGFKKNPMSSLFTRRYRHSLGENLHETERNFRLIEDICTESLPPRIYPSAGEMERMKPSGPTLVMAPASVWATKQWPAKYWSILIGLASDSFEIKLIGGKEDKKLCERIAAESGRNPEILAGKLSFLESASLLKQSSLTISNDSAPVHLASAVNAPILELFCSTVPAFGFTPLSSRSFVMETSQSLSCRPCGLHGKKECPLGHFQCGNTLTPTEVWQKIKAITAQN